GEDPFGRVGVMSTAGRMDMMVAAIKSVIHRIDPTFQLNRNRSVTLFWNHNFFLELAIFGPPAIGHRKLAGRQHNGSTVRPIDLLLKEEIGGEPLGLQWIHPACLVAKRKSPHGRRAVEVSDR